MRLTPAELCASSPARSRGDVPLPGGRRAVPRFVLLVALLALTAGPVAASGGPGGGSPRADAVREPGPIQAVAGLPADPAGDLGALPETDTEVQSREAPPLEVMLLAAALGLGLALYVLRRPRRPD